MRPYGRVAPHLNRNAPITPRERLTESSETAKASPQTNQPRGNVPRTRTRATVREATQKTTATRKTAATEDLPAKKQNRENREKETIGEQHGTETEKEHNATSSCEQQQKGETMNYNVPNQLIRIMFLVNGDTTAA